MKGLLEEKESCLGFCEGPGRGGGVPGFLTHSFLLVPVLLDPA